METNIYIDGFNLYYGRLRGTPYKWLDIDALCRLLVPRDLRGASIHRIRYFTARVRARPNNPHQALRQQIYIRALETIPHLSVHYGYYLESEVWMRVVSPPPGAPISVKVHKTEEKGSDVNLASHLLVDAFDSDYEAAVIISNDSDLVGPVQIVRQKFGLPVGVYYPQRRVSHPLKISASFYRSIPEDVLRQSQFPTQLTDRNGTITKPPGW